MSIISIVCSGEKWIGYGYRTFLSIIEEMMTDARREIIMTVYLITDAGVIGLLEDALKRGVRVEIFINYYNLQNEDDAYRKLIGLKERYGYLTIYTKKDMILHAKILVADAEQVLVGSANPTFSGLVKNYEIGLLVRDREVALKVLNLLRRLA